MHVNGLQWKGQYRIERHFSSPEHFRPLLMYICYCNLQNSPCLLLLFDSLYFSWLFLSFFSHWQKHTLTFFSPILKIVRQRYTGFYLISYICFSYLSSTLYYQNKHQWIQLCSTPYCIVTSNYNVDFKGNTQITTDPKCSSISGGDG